MEVMNYLKWIQWRFVMFWMCLTFAQGGGQLSTKQEKVCDSIDIRNSVDEFSKIENCTVIEGHLEIVLIEHAAASEYERLYFPKLLEITDYLLLYRVYGLKTLSHIFPNLSVIRGQNLFFNYALVLFEVPDIEEVGLPGLTRIVRGAVRLEKNQNLCYVKTVNWEPIISSNDSKNNFITENKNIDECVDYCPKVCPNRECWTAEHCQISQCSASYCGLANASCYKQSDRSYTCCHAECLGGCTGPTERECHACKHVFHNGRCQSRCPSGTYEYLERRCVTEEECRSFEGTSWKVLDTNKCERLCPTDYTENKTDEHKCEKCEGPCPKVCHGLVIDNVAAAQKLQGCTEIHGILEIQIRGGTQVERELEKYLGGIELITKYIRITQSNALTTLSFLKNLTVIEGQSLYKHNQESYALVVLDNEYMQDIWDLKTHRQLRIGNGKVFFHFNRRLCLHKIDAFLSSMGMKESTTTADVSNTNNGDLTACNITDIDINLIVAKSKYAIISWSNYYNSDARELLGWVVNYRKAPFKNVTMFDARDACNSDLWKTEDVRPEFGENPQSSLAQILHQLEPNTQYAVYVQSYTVSSAIRGALSPILYFTTEADIPTEPQHVRVEATGSSELRVVWDPPLRPNGKVTHYYVRWLPQKLSAAKFELRDYCQDPLLGRDKKNGGGEEGSAENEKPEQAAVSNDTCIPKKECCACPKTEEDKKAEEEERMYQIEFQNFLQNSVYHAKSDYRRKRGLLDSVLDDLARDDQEKAARGMTRGSVGGDSYDRKKRSAMYYQPLGMLALNDTYNITATTPNLTISEEEHDEDFYQTVEVHNKLEVMLLDLAHFQEYSIEVIACHDFNPVTGLKLCSQRAITSSRTLPQLKADMVDLNNVTVSHMHYPNQTRYIHLRWPEPADPNGLIVNYDIEAKRQDVAGLKPLPYCLTHKHHREFGGYDLDGLGSGRWSFRIRTTSLAGFSEWTNYMDFTVPHDPKDQTATPVWMVIVPVIVTVICVTVMLLLSCWYFQRKRYNVPDQPLYSSVNPDYVGFTEVYVADEWEVDMEKVELVKEVGQGSFGMVFEGIAHDIAKEDMEPEFHGKIRVAVKTVAKNASYRDRVEFLNEASVMKEFRSYHVLRLLGVVSKTQPSYVIMEYMANGDLKTFLRMHRPDYEEGNHRRPPTVGQSLQMAGEIADGMAYLADKKYVHRDLAARNCMVNDKFVVKIGDFGMTRDIYDTDYYRKAGKGCLPVRWMAPESLRDGTYTSQSDVWSFGVVLWEMATLATQPYQGLSNEEVLKYVVNKNIMEIPEKCPEKIHKMMMWCWEYYDRNRPTFTQIIEFLEPDLSDSFVEKSFYFNPERAPSSVGIGGGGGGGGGMQGQDDDETCMNWEEDEGVGGVEDVATPLTGTPQHAPPPLESYSDTHSTLSYDSSRKPSPTATPPNTNQNSYLFGGGGGLGEGDTRRYPPHVLARTSGGGMPNGPTAPPAPPQKDPVVLKETAHLWQRPPSPSRGMAGHNHSLSSPQGGGTEYKGGDGAGPIDQCNHVDNSRDSSKSSGGSGGRNGITNGHIPHRVTPAQC